jgi:hypothetical protein
MRWTESGWARVFAGIIEQAASAVVKQSYGVGDQVVGTTSFGGTVHTFNSWA